MNYTCLYTHLHHVIDFKTYILLLLLLSNASDRPQMKKENYHDSVVVDFVVIVTCTAIDVCFIVIRNAYWIIISESTKL